MLRTAFGSKLVLLSFDTEEFDLPRESNVPFDTLGEGMEVSKYGTAKILEILKRQGVCATFFCTGNFAQNAPEIMRRLVADGHEVACHGVDHWSPQESDVRESKRIMESVLGEIDADYLKAHPVAGYRQPRMFAVSDEEIERSGFKYNSSLNPAFIPGRYMHLNMPRTWFYKGEVLQIPVSVTPIFRIPLFWLALHNFPERLYRYFVRRVLKRDGYFTTYFHPWEFYNLKAHPEYKAKWIIRNHCGEELAARLERLIESLKRDGCEFVTYSKFAENCERVHK